MEYELNETHQQVSDLYRAKIMELINRVPVIASEVTIEVTGVSPE